jgi:hypothetical protein
VIAAFVACLPCGPDRDPRRAHRLDVRRSALRPGLTPSLHLLRK